MQPKRLTTLTAIAALAAGPALADFVATATTDLNLRAGPGPNYDVKTVIDGQGEVRAEGCLADYSWCRVSYDGVTGWAYAAYLRTDHMGDRVVVYDDANEIDLGIVELDFDPASTALGAVGATTGALLGGPAAIAAGAAAGAILGDEISEDDVAYVEANPVEPVYLEGEVVRGARLPADVTLYGVPGSDYDYVYVNNVAAMVDPDDRSIVYVVRG